MIWGEGKTEWVDQDLTTLSNTNHESPNINKLDDLLSYYKLSQELVRKNILNAYHDRSDGGLITTLIEMAFASNMSVDLKNVSKKSKTELIKFLFNEELGGIFAIDKKCENEFIKLTRKYCLEAITHNIGDIIKKGKPTLKIESCNYSEPISKLRKYWSELSYLIQSERDNKKTALSEYKAKIKSHQTNREYLTPKLHYRVSNIAKKYLNKRNKPIIIKAATKPAVISSALINNFKLSAIHGTGKSPIPKSNLLTSTPQAACASPSKT